MVVSLAALFVALGGAGYAATGQTFILGHANSAANTSALASGVTTGPTLLLSNTGASRPAASFRVGAGVSPFTVNSKTEVPNLNASLLGGQTASQLATKVDYENGFGGPFPSVHDESFTSSGGPLLVFLNGSAYASTTGQTLELCVTPRLCPTAAPWLPRTRR
jgi:hypothetical protein